MLGGPQLGNTCKTHLNPSFKFYVGITWGLHELKYGLHVGFTTTNFTYITKLTLTQTMIFFSKPNPVVLQSANCNMWQRSSQGGLTVNKKLLVQRWPPPHDLSTRRWLTYFHGIVLLELSTA